MATVVFTPAAEREVDDLHAWISQRAGERIADAFVERIVSYCLGFSTFPERGRKRDDLLPGLRTIGFERRVTIAFVIDGDLVSIEGVFYGGRDFERKTSVNE
ncbi:MAG TPA: type II toxin-antitoxin system RelE/ParE family toxin [Methylosinus sp.]|jgi:toxin ParE1/3/4|uniref:type II toxin-antitoxin system RelE/ParE family toxin n=1 Tax=Methylosinus sp. TaxID=427 RepID=UPI002F924D2F